MGAVKNALQRDGLDPSIMDLDPEKSITSQLNKDEDIIDKGPPLKDDPQVSVRPTSNRCARLYFRLMTITLDMICTVFEIFQDAQNGQCDISLKNCLLP